MVGCGVVSVSSTCCSCPDETQSVTWANLARFGQLLEETTAIPLDGGVNVRFVYIFVHGLYGPSPSKRPVRPVCPWHRQYLYTTAPNRSRLLESSAPKPSRYPSLPCGEATVPRLAPEQLASKCPNSIRPQPLAWGINCDPVLSAPNPALCGAPPLLKPRKADPRSQCLSVLLALGDQTPREAAEVVVDGAGALSRGGRGVHARAQGLLDGRAAAPVVAGRGPAGCLLSIGLVWSFFFFLVLGLRGVHTQDGRHDGDAGVRLGAAGVVRAQPLERW